MKKNDHKFKGDLYPLFYGKKKAFFVGLIKNNKFFAINLCLFIALIYDKKMIINLWAICTHKFLAKKRCIFMIFFGIKNFLYFLP